MKFFGLPFGDAIKKINEDFSLGLPIGEKLDRRKQLEMNRQAFIRKREVRRAKDTGIKLIVLIESNKYTDIPSLIDWKSKYSGVNGRSLIDAIYRAHISYGVQFIFCNKRSTGRRIVELLQG